MALIETLITGMGTAIAKGILKLWLKDEVIALETTTSLTDILSKKISNFREKRATERLFEEIADQVGESISQMLKKEASEISEKQLEIIANAASETINQTEINSELLVKQNLDPQLLANFFLERTGIEGGNPGFAFSENSEERSLYVRLLNHASQVIVDISSQFPQFTERVFGELLEGQDKLLSISKQVLNSINIIIASQEGKNLEVERFESDYRLATIRRLDRLQLFGVDLEESNQRYQLSVAYVSLNMEKTSHGPEQEINANAIDDELSDSESLTVNDALASTKRLLVRGPAGSGKSTLLQWIAVSASGRTLNEKLEPLNDCISFLIRLREFSDQPLPSPEIFPMLISSALGGVPDRWAHNILKQGLGIILIDGIDEAPEDLREEIKNWLNDLIIQYPDSRYIVTSRPHAVKEGWLDGAQFVDATLQEMERKDIFAFIDHWHSAVSHNLDSNSDEYRELIELAPSLKDKIQLNTALFQLANSPLLCALLCALHRERSENLPSHRNHLYQSCINMFFRRDIERKVAMRDYPMLSDPQKLFFLQDYAWWMIRNGKSSVSVEEAIEKLQSLIPQLTECPENTTGESLFRLFVERVGILRQFASERIDFPHRTFQEYLAACQAAKVNDTGELINHAVEDQWREVAILAADHLNAEKAETYIQDLLHKGDSDTEHQLTYYLIAAAALKARVSLPPDSSLAIEVSQRLSYFVPPETLTDGNALATAGELVAPLLRYNKNWKAKQSAAAVRTLSIIGTDAAIDLLCDYLVDKRSTIHKQISHALRFVNEDHETKITNHANILINNRKIEKPKMAFCKVNCEFITTLKHLRLKRSTKRLRLDNCGSLKDITTISKYPNLETLTIYECHLLSGLEGLSGNLSLKILYSRGCWSFKDLDGLQNCSNLKKIELHHCWSLKNISALKQVLLLESLDLHHCTDLQTLDGLQNCNNLQNINLWGTGNLNDVSALDNCNKLISFRLFGSHHLTNISFINNCPHLRNFELTGCRQLNLRNLSILEKSCEIESIELTDCEHLIDLSQLVQFKNLATLKLLGSKSLLESSLISLSSCEKLETLYLSDCEQITNLNSMSNCFSLKKLKLSNCNNLNNIKDLSNCQQLSSLELKNCNLITISETLELSQCEALRTLKISTSNLVTEDEFEKLEEAFPQVNEFEIYSDENNYSYYYLRDPIENE